MFDPFFDLFATLLAWFYGLVPNYGDRHHPADARRDAAGHAAHAEGHPLDARAAEAPARAAEDPDAVPRRPPEDERRADEVLQGAQDQPAGWLPAAAHPAAGLHHPLQRHPGADDPHLAAGGGLPGDPSLAGHFDPKYLDESSELYQALHGNDEMVSFGIDLARTPLQAMADGLGTAWPYLLLVVGIAVTSYVPAAPDPGPQPGAINPQMQMITAGHADHVRQFFSLNFPAGLAVYWCTSGCGGSGSSTSSASTSTPTRPRPVSSRPRRNEAVAGADGNGQPGQGGFLDKLLGGAQPNLKAGRDGDGKSARRSRDRQRRPSRLQGRRASPRRRHGADGRRRQRRGPADGSGHHAGQPPRGQPQAKKRK